MIAPLALKARDVSGQHRVRVRNVDREMTVGELVSDVLTQMRTLPRTDVDNSPLAYHARLDREGRHLHTSELVGEALQPDDEIVLQPNIQAG